MGTMSPVSRVRKKNAEPTPQSLNGLFKDILRDFSSLGADPDPLEVELLTSEVVGQWWDLPVGEVPADADDEAVDEELPVGLELIAFVSRKITPGAAALLASMSVLSETAEEREAASAALETVLSRGIPAPDWTGSLGQVTVVECWRTGDVYGDESSLLCIFGYGEQRHGLLALLDFNELGGRVRDVVVIDAPEEVLADMRGQAASDGDLVTLEQVSPGRARQLLADGLAATDALEEPEVGEDYARFRALALNRCQALPEAEPSPVFEELSDEDRDAIVEEFLSSADVEDTEAARVCARLIVDFGCENEPGDPLRVGPEKIARFLEMILDTDTDAEADTEEDVDEFFPDLDESGASERDELVELDQLDEEFEEFEGELDEDFQAALPEVLLAWTQWAGTRAKLSESAVAMLLGTVEEYLEEFDRDDTAIDVYLDGSEEFEDAGELAAALDRRMFAIPSVSTDIGDEEVDLEPTDPEQRRLLVIGEHPEYHESLADDTFDGEPRMQLALKTAIVDQLWDNEPAETWLAAQRLREKGLERDEILDELGGVLSGQLRPTDAEEMRFDLEDYRRALDAIS
jgi:hypothetical protein